MLSDLPFSQACENNKAPILEVLRRWLADRDAVLEIGSGTGQHAVHFAAALPHLTWHASDLANAHTALNARFAHHALANLRGPQLLDARDASWWQAWSDCSPDAIYSANTAHIMHWPAVCSMLGGAGRLLPPDGLLLLYGPFSDAGEHNSDGNRAFDRALREQDPGMGIRDVEALDEQADAAGMSRIAMQSMPANNRVIVWQRQ